MHLFAVFALIFSLQVFAADKPFTIQLGADPYSLDPIKIKDQSGFGIAQNVNEGLFRIDGEGKLQNALAQSYTVSKDRRTYRFRVRPDAKWSDGKKVGLEDFVLGMRRAMDPSSGCYDAELLYSVKNARAVNQGKLPPDKLGVRAEKDELVIELESPDESLLSELSMPLTFPTRADFFQDKKKDWDYRNPVTGRYKIANYQPAEKIELVPNPQHRDPPANKVTFQILTEDAAAMNLFKSGALDIISTITLTEIPALRAAGKLHTSPSTTVMYLAFNTAAKPFDNLEWRKAVAHSINREEMAGLLQGSHRATTSYMPSTLKGYKELPYGEDFKQAAAKIRAQKDKPPVAITYGGGYLGAVVLQKVQNDLRAKLDLSAELKMMEWTSYLAALDSNPPMMFYVGMGAPYDDPMMHLKSFLSSEGGHKGNRSQYKNPEYDKLLDDIRRTPKGEKRTQLIQKAQSILVLKDAVLVPLTERLQIYGVSPAIKGFQVNPHAVIQLEKLKRQAN